MDKLKLTALNLRESVKITGNVLDVIKLANNLGIKVYSERFRLYENQKISGVVIRKNNTPYIYVNEKYLTKEKRVSIAKMLGWIVLNEGLNDFEKVFLENDHNFNTDDKLHMVVNDFSIYLLIDDSKFYDYLSNLTKVYNESNIASSLSKDALIKNIIDTLSNEFDVSNSLVEYKLLKDGYWK
jgi:Zn-dependent peptidase ImmA (M78 family)